jgi:hypothetical protein
LQFALVLTVAAIPVAMPTVLSVTMAVGARTLAKKKAIVTRLAAIEELAGVEAIRFASTIKVELPVTRLPPCKSRRAEFPHRAFQNCSLCTIAQLDILRLHVEFVVWLFQNI